MIVSKLFLFLILSTCLASASWNSDELALYDLVEEIGTSFYDFFGITREATLSEIKKAYRKLSLEYHPDRNSAEDATVKFRNVVAIYEVLKSSELREKYNNVLDNGLPDWRQPIYYYRKMRKFTWYEAMFVLLSVATIAHYCMMWASYYEKKLVLNQTVKRSKKKKSGESEEENKKMLEQALQEHLPNVFELLPFILIKSFGNLAKFGYALFIERMNPTIVEEEVDEPIVKRRAPMVPKTEYHFELAKNVKVVTMNDPSLEEKFKKEAAVTALKQTGAGWSCEELSLLIRLSSEKYPPGTPSRWDLIGRALNRNSDDVTAMAGKLKNMKQEDYHKLVKGQQSENLTSSDPAVTASASEWSQGDQKLFEQALQKFPRGTEDRWGRISEVVQGKSKDECMARFKQLAEIVKKKKLQQA